MKISRRNNDSARLNQAAVGCFFNGSLAGGVEALSEQPGKQRRHVLHHQDGQRKLAGIMGRIATQCGRSSRRDSDDDHLGAVSSCSASQI